MAGRKKTTASTIDEYLAALPADQRAALRRLRATIRAAAPKAEECISYRLPTFRLGAMLVAFGATSKHCAFYLLSAKTLPKFAKATKGLDISAGTIRFAADEPLPAALVKKLVLARLAENADLAGKTAKPKPAAQAKISKQDIMKKQVAKKVTKKVTKKRAVDKPRGGVAARVLPPATKSAVAAMPLRAPAATVAPAAAHGRVMQSQVAAPSRPVVRRQPASTDESRRPATGSAPPAEGKDAVDAFLRDSDHPLKSGFEAVRAAILDASPSIGEGVKWNAPSFRTTDWFATLFLREPQRIQIVFHLGAKKHEGGKRVQVGAPEGMVEWLAPDRCMVTVGGLDDVRRRSKALQAFVRAWILHV